MGKVSASNPYTNKQGDRRIGVQLDYQTALSIATGDLEALDTIKRALTMKVEAVERKAQNDFARAVERKTQEVIGDGSDN